MGMFDTSVNYDAMPIGSVIQSPINLERVTDGKWIALDGRDCNRSDYPELAPYFPAGVFTSTARTLASAPANATIAVHPVTGTQFIAAATVGTGAIQVSSDGITWQSGSSWGASTGVASIVAAGSRTIIAGSGGDMSAPYVSTLNSSDFALSNKANWTATTGGVATTLTQGLAYSPTLGRTVLIPNGAGTAIYTLDDGSTTWASRTVTSATKQAICWTGERFIVITTSPLYHYSTDGTTWSDGYLTTPDIAGASQVKTIASDGKGTVVYAEYNNTNCISSLNFLVSRDHGRTWGKVPYPQELLVEATYAAVWRIEYVNGRFIANAAIATGFAHSHDGYSWNYEPIQFRGSNNAFSVGAFKSGVYCFIRSGNTGAQTATEDFSKMRLSPTHNVTQYASARPAAATLLNYIKARN